MASQERVTLVQKLRLGHHVVARGIGTNRVNAWSWKDTERKLKRRKFTMAQWGECFSKQTSVAIVIVFWLKWAGYLAMAGLAWKTECQGICYNAFSFSTQFILPYKMEDSSLPLLGILPILAKKPNNNGKPPMFGKRLFLLPTKQCSNLAPKLIFVMSLDQEGVSCLQCWQV